MGIVCYNGEEFGFERALQLMEPELRDMLLERMMPCSEQELLDGYAAAYLAIHGEEFFVP